MAEKQSVKVNVVHDDAEVLLRQDLALVEAWVELNDVEVKVALIRKGLSRDQLAHELDVSKVSISRWLNRHAVTWDTARRIAQLLDMEPELTVARVVEVRLHPTDAQTLTAN